MPAIDTKHLTFADYLLLPTITQRYDIIDGEMAMAAAPTWEHQDIIGNLYLVLRFYLDGHQRGRVVFAPCDILMQREPLRTRQPDLFVILSGRADVGNLETRRTQSLIEVAPDITIEVISKHETRRSRADKIEDYRRLGVKECWIVSPQAQTVEVLRLSPEGMRTVGIFGTGMQVQSELLQGLDLPVDDIFA
jgi:Uma2 family endonuclease